LQLAGLREVADERRQLAAEHAVEEALALGGEVVVAPDQRAVAHPAALARRCQRLLLQEPADQRLHGGGAPALRRRGLGDDRVEEQRRAPPQRVHAPAFRVAAPPPVATITTLVVSSHHYGPSSHAVRRVAV